MDLLLAAYILTHLCTKWRLLDPTYFSIAPNILSICIMTEFAQKCCYEFLHAVRWRYIDAGWY